MCLNLVATQHPNLCVSYLEMLSGCFSSDDTIDADVQLTPISLSAKPSDPQLIALRRLTALRLLLLLYQRWPGILGSIQSPLIKAWLTQPWRIRDCAHDHPWLKTIADLCDQPLGNVDLISQPEVSDSVFFVFFSPASGTLDLAACRSLPTHDILRMPKNLLFPSVVS